MPAQPAPAALRTLDVLDLLATEPKSSLSLSDIAKRLALPRATCQSLLLALVDRGFLVRHQPSITYSLGPACLRVGNAAREAAPLAILAEPEARALAEQTGLSVGVVARAGNGTSIVSSTPAASMFAVSLRPGRGAPLMAPFGAVFFAWADDDEVERWQSACQPPLTAAERMRMVAALQAIRVRGYSIGAAPDDEIAGALSTLSEHPPGTSSPERRQIDAHMREMASLEYLVPETLPDRPMRISQMSAPIFDDHPGSSEVNLAIMLLGPPQRLEPAAIGQLGDLILAAANRISRTTTFSSVPSAVKGQL
jgi:DNA-binding IclR family transcriptional regulator